jgi:hypothetical protein
MLLPETIVNVLDKLVENGIFVTRTAAINNAIISGLASKEFTMILNDFNKSGKHGAKSTANDFDNRPVTGIGI